MNYIIKMSIFMDLKEMNQFDLNSDKRLVKTTQNKFPFEKILNFQGNIPNIVVK